MSDLLSDSAAEYLKLGLSIIALTGKTPNVSIHRRGLHEPIVGPWDDTPEDWALIYRAFRHKDTTGIGIVIPYPYVVVDIDGEEGALQFRDLITPDMQEDPLDVALESLTWTARTPRGMHLWFACFQATGSMKLGAKLDLKGQASYVAAPPSLHPEGGRYEWLVAPWESNVVETPIPLTRLIEDHAYDVASAQEARETRRHAWGPQWQEGDHRYYAQASHDSIIERMSSAAEGNRNNYLHWAAATLAEEGASAEEFEQLAEAALAVGLERVEVHRTLRSARRTRGEG